MKRCPFCAEEIQDAAIICRFCQRELPASQPIETVAWSVQTAAGSPPSVKVSLIRILLAVFVSVALAIVVGRVNTRGAGARAVLRPPLDIAFKRDRGGVALTNQYDNVIIDCDVTVSTGYERFVARYGVIKPSATVLLQWRSFNTWENVRPSPESMAAYKGRFVVSCLVNNIRRETAFFPE